MKLPFGLSYFWDVFLPLGVAGVPAALFILIGWLLEGIGPPGAVPAWVVAAMGFLQILGMVAMAVVALVRYELGVQQLQAIFPNGPARWRGLCLFVGVCCLTLFDLLTNIGAAFGAIEGVALMLVLLAVPFYLTYLFLVRLSLWGATAPADESPYGGDGERGTLVP